MFGRAQMCMNDSFDSNYFSGEGKNFVASLLFSEENI